MSSNNGEQIEKKEQVRELSFKIETVTILIHQTEDAISVIQLAKAPNQRYTYAYRVFMRDYEHLFKLENTFDHKQFLRREYALLEAISEIMKSLEGVRKEKGVSKRTKSDIDKIMVKLGELEETTMEELHSALKRKHHEICMRLWN